MGKVIVMVAEEEKNEIKQINMMLDTLNELSLSINTVFLSSVEQERLISKHSIQVKTMEKKKSQWWEDILIKYNLSDTGFSNWVLKYETNEVIYT